MIHRTTVLVFALLLSVAAGAGGEEVENDWVYQITPAVALSAGVLEGTTRFREVGRLGDFGLGALSPVDGEVIVLDGQAYHAGLSGRTRKVRATERTAFTTLKHFSEDRILALRPVDNLDQLGRLLDARLVSVNRVYALRVEGRFRTLTLRSVPRQRRPYPSIDQVVAEQRVFQLQDVAGTLVGFRTPAYLAAITGAGYHFHFIDRERRRGGHVLNVSGEDFTVSVDQGDGVVLLLPENEEFDGADLRGDAERAARFQRAVRGMPGD